MSGRATASRPQKQHARSTGSKTFMAQLTSPELEGRRAAAWIDIWGGSPRSRRVMILNALKLLHGDSNSSRMEQDLGAAAPLFFTRLTSWWKLRYRTIAEDARLAAALSLRSKSTASKEASPSLLKSSTGQRDTVTPSGPPEEARLTSNLSAAVATAGASIAAVTTTTLAAAAAATISPESSELVAQVEAITIFIRGSPYLLQFTENGGAATLTDCLQSAADPSLQAGRETIALLLLYIANAGRVYRELLCSDGGLLKILQALQQETDGATATLLTDLLAVLGQGHPTLSGQIHTGLLRILASATAVTSSGDDGSAPKAEVVPPTATEEAASLHRNSVIALCTARAIRGLQLQGEQHHFQAFPAESMASEDPNHRRDFVPIVGLDDMYTTTFPITKGGRTAAMVESRLTLDPLLRPLAPAEYLEILFRLAIDVHSTAYRVEGDELLTLAAKNMTLCVPIITRCFDIVDEDVLRIDQDDGVQGILTQQRRQLSCGRTAALIFLSKPMTAERQQLLLRLVTQRSGHLTLLKYLRLTHHGDTAAVVDCCKALQFLARAASLAQRNRLGVATTPLPPSSSSSATTPGKSSGEAAMTAGGPTDSVMGRLTRGIQDVIGDALFQVLLFQSLSEEDCLAMLRAARATVNRIGDT